MVKNLPAKYSCLGNPTDRGAWWATVHGVVKGQIQLERLNNNNDDRQLQGDPLIPYPEPANFTDLSED